MSRFLFVAITALAVLAVLSSQAPGTLGSSESRLGAMSRQLATVEQPLTVEFGNLRGLLFNANGRPFMKEPCTLYQKSTEYEKPSDDKPALVWECELHPTDAYGIKGIFFAFEGFNPPSNNKDNNGNPLISGESTLFANGIQLNHGQAKALFPQGVRPAYGRRPRRHRHLATVTGTKPVLAVRVIGADTSTTASMVEISDSIFGTAGDPVNLKSQFAACSFNKLNISPAPGFADGVVTVTIPDTISGASDGTIRNAVTTALTTAGISTPSSAHHIMYCLPPGTSGGWIAYAYINSWNSVYNNEWCTYVSGQMHEIGHNLNLAHANEGTTAYGDQSGMMGYSYSQDDGPKMCFNAAKSWQLRWYEDKHATVNPVEAGWESDMVGIVDYERASNGESVLLQIDVPGNTTDYYVNYNRATDFNSGTLEGGNQLMVTIQGGSGTDYSESSLLSKMNAGGSYTITNFGGTSKSLTIEFVSIDMAGPYHVARVRVSGPANPTSVPTPTPTPAPTTASPTPPPTAVPPPVPTTAAPTPPPTPQLTPAPATAAPTSLLTPVPTPPHTAAPTTAQPTAPPTLSPTPFPTTASPTATPTLQPTVAPVTPTPAPVTPTPAPMKICSKQNEQCSSVRDCCNTNRRNRCKNFKCSM